MAAPIRPSKVYSPPSYVKVLSFAGLACVLGGVLALGIALANEDSVALGISLLVAGGLNIFYAEIANAIAMTNWRTELLAWELQPAIDELRLQADEREKRERAAEVERQADILRRVREREAKEASAGDDSSG